MKAKLLTIMSIIVYSLCFLLPFILTSIKELPIDTNLIAIKENYSFIYSDNMYLSISIYTNQETLFQHKLYNSFYIYNKEVLVNLECVDCTYIGKQVLLSNEYLEYNYRFNLPNLEEDLVIEDAILKIENEIEAIDLEIGNLFITYQKGKILLFNDYYPIYEKNTKEKLAGLVIKFDEIYYGKQINEAYIGSSRCEEVLFSLNEIFEVNGSNEDMLYEGYYLFKNTNNYFIRNTYFVVIIDNEAYYIANMNLSYSSNELAKNIENISIGEIK